MADTEKQSILLSEVKKFLSNRNIKYRFEDESGDYMFYCESRLGNEFTFELTGQYVEFFSNRTFNVVNYFDGQYVDSTLKMIDKYMLST